MMIASMYVINEKPFDLRRFESLSDYVKEQVGAFNTLKSSYRYTTAAMLDVRFENSVEKFHRLLEVYEKMVSGKFSRGASTYIAAQVMLEQIENGRTEDIERVMQVYKGMSSNHFFLTSSTDFPLAVLLAEREGTVNDLMKQIEYFYKCLNQQGFAKGNDLQFLSHILSLGDENKADALNEQCTKVADAFRTQWKKPRAMHYPLAGLLALLKRKWRLF